ncbi:hypothetical protein SEA_WILLIAMBOONE_37 [Gordonia phage WilliamBoone]|nr:hypothetical protein SEA_WILLIAMBOONE_37 [Gordonia phage WilliamBoone]
MAVYVEPEDVQKRYLNGELPTEWLETKIDDAEDDLFFYFPRLATSATDEEQRRIKRVVADAVIRLFNNPRGIIREQIEEQSVTLGGDGSLAGSLYFTERELAKFRTGRKRVGMIGVAPAPFAGRDA